MERKMQWKRCTRVLRQDREGPGRHEGHQSCEDFAKSPCLFSEWEGPVSIVNK